MYDYLIIGSGLYGAVSAYELRKAGKRVLVIEKRKHIGGNVYTERNEGINVHMYGPHIFHTNDEKIWNYVNQFAIFNNFILSPIAKHKDKLFNLPFNMNTFYQMWGVKTPQEAQDKIFRQTSEYKNITPTNLEEQAIKLVGRDIYETLIKGYTEKQWGRQARDLPPFIIKRLPIRFTFDNNYFNDNYQGIPIGGYTPIIERMLGDIEVRTDVDYFSNRPYFDSIAKVIIYTGCLDEFYNYQFGELEYRSLNFSHKKLNITNFQGTAIVNYTDQAIPYTRTVEHKHFEFIEGANTIVTEEYPQDWNRGREPYYPVNDDKNNAKYKLYAELAARENNVIFGGRLAEYRYYDMHQVIASALRKTRQQLERT